MGLLQSCISPKSPSVAINVLKHSFYYTQTKIHWDWLCSGSTRGGIRSTREIHLQLTSIVTGFEPMSSEEMLKRKSAL